MLLLFTAILCLWGHVVDANATTQAALTMSAQHHPGTGGFKNDVVYHFGVDNMEKAPQEGLAIQVNVPGGADVQEAYYYKEAESGDSGKVKVMHCNVSKTMRRSGKPTKVICAVGKVILHSTLYVHVVYPEGDFTSADLANLQEKKKVIALLIKNGKPVVRKPLPILATMDRSEL